MRRERGFTYFTVLFLVALLGLGTATVATVWQTERRREKEMELLAVGEEFRLAIERYVRATPSGRPAYPRRLEDLLRDPRVPGVARHLRRIHADPVTGRAQWGLVRSPDGGIMGVHSLSRERPLKRSGFPARHASFGRAESHADWAFVHSDRLVGVGAPRGGKR